MVLNCKTPSGGAMINCITRRAVNTGIGAAGLPEPGPVTCWCKSISHLHQSRDHTAAPASTPSIASSVPSCSYLRPMNLAGSAYKTGVGSKSRPWVPGARRWSPASDKGARRGNVHDFCAELAVFVWLWAACGGGEALVDATIRPIIAMASRSRLIDSNEVGRAKC
jgi:hypothetical protein